MIIVSVFHHEIIKFFVNFERMFDILACWWDVQNVTLDESNNCFLSTTHLMFLLSTPNTFATSL